MQPFAATTAVERPESKPWTAISLLGARGPDVSDARFPSTCHASLSSDWRVIRPELSYPRDGDKPSPGLPDRWWLFRRNHVAEIFLVLVAVHLEDVVVRHEIVVDLYGDGTDVILRIVPGDLGFKMAKVAAMIALGHVHVFASGMAHAVDRSVIVEAARFD